MMHVTELPNDVESLKALILAEREKHHAEVASLQALIRVYLGDRLGRRSERMVLDPNQRSLFNEAESAPIAEEGDTEDDANVVSRKRSRGHRRAISPDIPRVDVIHDLPESEKVCPMDGKAMFKFGEEVSEQLDIVPGSIQVLRHIRYKYGCDCAECVKIAPMPAQPIPKSMASAGLLAHIAVSKYADGLPLYRQEEIFARLGAHLPRGTQAAWMVKAGALVSPIVELMNKHLMQGRLIHADETPVQVLDEPGRAATSKSYMWVRVLDGDPARRIVLFTYDPSRSQEVARRLFAGFRGHLQVDGYDAYEIVCADGRVIRLGCLAHARRKFLAAWKASPSSQRDSVASAALAFIKKLYRIERACRGLDTQARYAARQAQAVPILNDFKAWLETVKPKILPKSPTGRAVQYLSNEWKYIVRYVDDGLFRIDNNVAENAIRPFVIGRKNWLFSQTPEGAKASAALYSLIETAKANRVDPYGYLRRVFETLPGIDATNTDELSKLLPYQVTA